MYGITEFGGKQYKAQVGDVLSVEKIDKKVGEKLENEKVLSIVDGKKNVFGTPFVKGASISYKVLEHGKNAKIKVFKKKRRKGYKITQGHRQIFTKIEILEIKTSGAKKSSVKEDVKEPVVKKTTAVKEEVKKPAVKKTIAVKKEVKKPVVKKTTAAKKEKSPKKA